MTDPTSDAKMKATAFAAAFRRNAPLALPVLLVNAAAIYGQQGWAYDHLGHSRSLAILFAIAVESIGVYLAAEAHAALMAGDASIRLRLASYAVGLLVGALNYAHFAEAAYRPNPLALTFGLLSSISPWLWAIRSRSLNRERLRTLGLVDPRAVRFAPLRWLLFPILTWRAFRGAVWAGIVQPAEAIALFESLEEPADSDAKRDQPDGTVRPLGPRARATAAKVRRAAAKTPTATPAQIAARVGKSEPTVRRYLKDTPTDRALVAA